VCSRREVLVVADRLGRQGDVAGSDKNDAVAILRDTERRRVQLPRGRLVPRCPQLLRGSIEEGRCPIPGRLHPGHVLHQEQSRAEGEREPDHVRVEVVALVVGDLVASLRALRALTHVREALARWGSDQHLDLATPGHAADVRLLDVADVAADDAFIAH
jgi:hypothetical protein